MTERPRRILDAEDRTADRPLRTMLESFDSAPPAAARVRVWQRITEPSRSRVSRWRWAAPLAAAAAIVLVLLAWPAQPPTSVPEAPVAKLPPAAPAMKPKTREPLVFPGYATVQPGAETKLRVRRVAPPVELFLEEGQLSVELVEASPGPIAVLAGPWTLSAAGRTFTVEWLGGALRVDASEARVRIEGPTTVVLERGERFDSRSRAAAPSPSNPPNPPETPPLPIAEPRPRPSPADRIEGQRELYERAKRSTGREAIALFDRAAHRDGPLTELSLYQAARLELTAGRAHAAGQRFEILSQRFPSGTLARETGLSLIECRLELGRLDEARSELDRYLRRYPDTERQDELRFLRAELHRKLGDCARARVDYADLGDGPRAEDALYLTAWCADRLGRAAEAKEKLSEYLRRFPSGRHAEAARGYLSVGRWSEKVQ